MGHIKLSTLKRGVSRQRVARRTGIAFLVFALAIQAFSVFVPAQAEAATSYDPAKDDMIVHGVSSKENILAHYDANTRNFRDIMTYNGITRAELASMSATRQRYQVKSTMHSWGWASHFTYAQGERSHKVAGYTAYSRPQMLWGYSSFSGWQGYSATRGTFYIMAACGNLVAETVPSPKPAAVCDKLTIERVNRNHVKLSASASVKDGATVSQIHYYIFNEKGTAVNATSANGSSNSVVLGVSSTGTFKAQAFAITSLGNVTSAACGGTFTVTEEQKPSISITKTVNKQKHIKASIGTEFTYEITVSNTGNTVLKNAAVTDKAPAEVALVKGSAGAITGNTWKYVIPTLKVGETKSFTITAKYAKYSAGTHKNTVCVDTPSVPGGPDGCDSATTETYENIEVCDLKDNKIKTIDRSQYDESHMTTDKSKCGNIEVCIISEKAVKTIAKKDYNESTMTTDMSKGEQQPTTPAELPHTGGIMDTLSGIFGVFGLGAVTYAYVLSRRKV